MATENKEYYLDLYVDEKSIGFDVSPNMVGYDTVVVIDNANTTKSTILSVNIQDAYLRRVLETMGDANIHALTFYVHLFKSEVNQVIYNARQNGQIISLKKIDDYYYGIDDLTGKGNALYVDSYGSFAKPVQFEVKFEIRTYRRPDGSNWTVVYTYPL